MRQTLASYAAVACVTPRLQGSRAAGDWQGADLISQVAHLTRLTNADIGRWRVPGSVEWLQCERRECWQHPIYRPCCCERHGGRHSAGLAAGQRGDPSSAGCGDWRLYAGRTSACRCGEGVGICTQTAQKADIVASVAGRRNLCWALGGRSPKSINKRCKRYCRPRTPATLMSARRAFRIQSLSISVGTQTSPQCCAAASRTGCCAAVGFTISESSPFATHTPLPPAGARVLDCCFSTPQHALMAAPAKRRQC